MTKEQAWEEFDLRMDYSQEIQVGDLEDAVYFGYSARETELEESNKIRWKQGERIAELEEGLKWIHDHAQRCGGQSMYEIVLKARSLLEGK